MTKNSINKVESAYERLRTATEVDTKYRIDLDELKRFADKGERLSWWSKRFVFGFGLAKAIEDWFLALDNADPKKSIIDRIPRDETSNVAAKWLWFGFFTSIVSIVLGLSVALITAIFLIKQTNVLAEQADIARKSSTISQRIQYAQILYDESCITLGDEGALKTQDEKLCSPTHNYRIRSVAALELVELYRDDMAQPLLKNAHLEGGEFVDGKFNDVNFFRSIAVEADFSNADLRNAILADADLSAAELKNADLTGAN